MVIEDFGPELIYIPGPTNAVADAISQLAQINNKKETQTNHDIFNIKSFELANLFAGNGLSEISYPVSFQIIQKEQVCETNLVNHGKKLPATSYRIFMGEESHIK